MSDVKKDILVLVGLNSLQNYVHVLGDKFLENIVIVVFSILCKDQKAHATGNSMIAFGGCTSRGV